MNSIGRKQLLFPNVGREAFKSGDLGLTLDQVDTDREDCSSWLDDFLR